MNKMNSFEKKVLETVRRYGMIKEGDRVLVGLSGGKDSAVLVYALTKLSSVLKCHVSALHVNHGIRGEEACRDERFSKALCEKLGVEFFSHSVSVPSLLKDSSLGLEAVAREVRYDAFYRFAEESGCNKIATAHTLTDNSETVLISLFRNATPSGIPPVRDMIIRPLIDVTSNEVIEYAEKEGLEFVEDSTNSCDDYLRNFIRHSILPELRERLGGLDSSLLKASKIDASFKALAQRQADEYIAANPNLTLYSVLTPLALDTAAHSMLFRVLSKIFEDNLHTLTFERFEKITSALKNPETSMSFSLDRGESLVFGYDGIYFEKEDLNEESYYIPLCRGENRILSTPFTVFLETQEEYRERVAKNCPNQQKINKLTKKISIQCNIIDSAFHIRSRRSGDSYVCGGITRNIKKYMVDMKIPKKHRHTFPIVCDGEGIVWVAGLGIADRLKTENDSSDLILSLSVTEDL